MNGVSDSTPRFNPKGIPAAPTDPLYGLVAAYEADTSKDKVDLGVGAYRDENAKPWVLPVVRKVSARRRIRITILLTSPRPWKF